MTEQDLNNVEEYWKRRFAEKDAERTENATNFLGTAGICMALGAIYFVVGLLQDAGFWHWLTTLV